MTKPPLYTVSPDDDISKAMKMVAQHDVNQLLIEHQGECAGILSRADIIRYIHLVQDLGRDDRTTGAPVG